MRSIFFLAALIMVSPAIGCGGRLPSPQTAHKLTTKFFQKYGKKHRQSDFGRQAIERVEIVGVHEIQKDLAEAEAYLRLTGGMAYRVRVTLQKKPLGWRAVVWENLGGP